MTLSFASSRLRCSLNPRTEEITIPVSIGRVLLSNKGVKTMVALGGVAIAVVLLCLFGTALGLPPVDSWPPAETPWPGNPESDVAAIPLARTNLLTPLFASGGQPQFEIPSVPQHTRPHSPAPPGQLPPGVYKTAPYTCIILVPGPCPDDRAVVSPRGGDSSMPIIRPDLHFIPIDRTK